MTYGKIHAIGHPRRRGTRKIHAIGHPRCRGTRKIHAIGHPRCRGTRKNAHIWPHRLQKHPPKHAFFFSKSTCFIVVHVCPFLLCFIRQMCATCQFYPVKWGAEDCRTTISPATVLVRRSRQIGMFFSLFIDLNVKTRDSERAK